jgi:hypothetical protein
VTKLLIALPTYPKPPLLDPLTQQALDAMAAPAGVEAEGRYLESAGRLTHYDDLVDKHSRARRMALDEGFDAVLFIEADMLPPADAIEKLLGLDAGVAYGLYCARSSGMWLVFEEIAEEGGRSISGTPERARQMWGQPMVSQGVGMGCTLIWRPVLEHIEFRRGRGPYADDWYFALDCAAAGIVQMHHLGVVCGHLLGDGRVVWPDPDAPGLKRYEQVAGSQVAEGRDLRSYVVIRKPLSTAGRTIAVGEVVGLRQGEAEVLIGRGLVEPAWQYDEPEEPEAPGETAQPVQDRRSKRRI